MSEQWRAMVGYEGYYEVSSRGRVRGVERTCQHSSGGQRRVPARIMKPYRLSRSSGGWPYWMVNFQKDGVNRPMMIHLAVLEAFHGPRPPDHEPYFRNGDRDDIRAANLKWRVNGTWNTAQGEKYQQANTYR